MTKRKNRRKQKKQRTPSKKSTTKVETKSKSNLVYYLAGAAIAVSAGLGLWYSNKEKPVPIKQTYSTKTLPQNPFNPKKPNSQLENIVDLENIKFQQAKENREP